MNFKRIIIKFKWKNPTLRKATREKPRLTAGTRSSQPSRKAPIKNIPHIWIKDTKIRARGDRVVWPSMKILRLWRALWSRFTSLYRWRYLISFREWGMGRLARICLHRPWSIRSTVRSWINWWPIWNKWQGKVTSPLDSSVLPPKGEPVGIRRAKLTLKNHKLFQGISRWRPSLWPETGITHRFSCHWVETHHSWTIRENSQEASRSKSTRPVWNKSGVAMNRQWKMKGEEIDSQKNNW